MHRDGAQEQIQGSEAVMKIDILIAGVGGQGVLSLGALLATAARDEGLHVTMSEVHGMAQRGGAVRADLRISDRPIHSQLVAEGDADLILSMEPLEALRMVHYLSPSGSVVTSSDPVENIPNYPDIERVVVRLHELPTTLVLVEALRLAREAGSPKATNVVLAGAAAHLLPIDTERLRQTVLAAFAHKGERLVEINDRAFAAGCRAASPTPVAV
jgi:indolepyruvate ferredoxin oxidoreductase beta subunit